MESGKRWTGDRYRPGRAANWLGAALGTAAEEKPDQAACTVGNRRRIRALEGWSAGALDLVFRT